MSGKAAPTAGPIWVMSVPFTFMSTWTRGYLFPGRAQDEADCDHDPVIESKTRLPAILPTDTLRRSR